MKIGRWCLLLLIVSPALWSGGIDDVKAALATPGKTYLQVDISAGDLSTAIPLTVLAGPKPGPTLLALAGIHGSEYSPIIATQRLAQELRAEELTGSLILVHTANLPAYLGRTIYVSPIDGKNLNRLFPGDATGTLSHRIAHALAQELFPLADAVLDMHSGDGNEQLRPSWTGYYARAGSETVVAASRALALAFGLPHIVEFQWELKGRESAIWAGSAAVAQGIPSIDVEAGGMGVIDPLAIEQIRNGVKRVLVHLGMLQATLDPPPAPIFIRDRTSIRSPIDGSWNPLVDAGERVQEGQKLGVVTDWHGRPVFEVIAPADGLLLLRLEAPPVRQGETLITLALVPP